MSQQTKKRVVSSLASLILLLDLTQSYVVDHEHFGDYSEYYRVSPYQDMIRRSYNQRRGGSDNNNNNYSGETQRPSYAIHDGERITSQKFNIGHDSMNYGPVSNANEYNSYLNLKESEQKDSYSNIPVERDSSEEIIYGGHENKKENVGGYFNSKEGVMYKGWSSAKDLTRGGSGGGYGKVISLKPSHGKGSSYSGGGAGFSSGYSSGTGGYTSGAPVQKASASSYISGLGSTYGGYGAGSRGDSSGYGSHDSGHKGGEHKGYTQATYIATKTDHSDSGHHGHGHEEEHGHDHHNDGYEFDYSVHDPHTHDFKSQKEHSDGHVVKGQYTVVQPDGLLRTVDYIADWKTGFQAKVHYSPAPKHDEHGEHAYSSANFNLFNKGHH